jgi:hypothetical protein
VLAQSFEENSTGAVFTVAVNHFKSKGSECNDLGDPDTGDGSGNCNLTRLAAAQALVDWLAADPTGSGDADTLIIGDLNSYDHEAPIDAIEAGPDDTPGTPDDYTDLVRRDIGEYGYSYVFDGQNGYLDYGLASASMESQVTGITEWHIDADEPDVVDYDTSFKAPAQQALYEDNAYRASDHDPVLIGLDLNRYAYSGLRPPIHSGNNQAQAGSVVVLQFALHGASQAFADGYPAWQACSGGPEVTAQVIGRPFHLLGNYLVLVKTPKSFAGTCQNLKVLFTDGTHQEVSFQFHQSHGRRFF